MKVVLIIVGALVALVILVYVVGALLPRDHVAGSAIVVPQPADTVWRTVRDIGAMPTWWPDVTSSQRVSDAAGREVWEQKASGFTMRLIVTEDVPPRRLVMTIDAAADAPFGGKWTYEVTPGDGATRVSVTEAGYVTNPLFRFMAKFVFGYYATQDKYLRALAMKLGASAEPVHATNAAVGASN